MMDSKTAGAATLVAEEGLTPQDRKKGILYLDQTQSGLLGAIHGLSIAHWTHRPTEECWTIGEIVEHIVFVLERVGGPTQQALANAPAPPADHDYQSIDSIIIQQFPSRLAKFKAPEFSLPSGRYATPAEASAAIRQAFATLRNVLETAPDLRGHAIESFPLKAATNGRYDLMDGFQWVLAATAHAERHTKQILEVRAHEGFPA